MEHAFWRQGLSLESASDKRARKNALKRAWQRQKVASETPRERSERLARKNAAQKIYYRRHREEVLARQKTRRQNATSEERARVNERARLNHDAKKEREARLRRLAAMDPERLAAYRERKRARDKAWQERNRDRYLEGRRRKRGEHREALRLAFRRWYVQNRESVLAKKRDAYARDVDNMRLRGRVQRSKRREWIAQSPGHYTVAEWVALVEAWGHRCAYCGTRTARLHADHRIPVSKGGSNLIENILPACADCNFRKHTMTELEFRALLAREARGLHEERFGYG